MSEKNLTSGFTTHFFLNTMSSKNIMTYSTAIMTKAHAMPTNELIAIAIAMDIRILMENTKKRNTTRKMSAESMRTPLSAASSFMYSAFIPTHSLTESKSRVTISTFLSDEIMIR